jgi:hypothetical protein
MYSASVSLASRNITQPSAAPPARSTIAITT